MNKIERMLSPIIIDDLQHEAGVVLLGSRQVGKTTLAKEIGRQYNGIYLDLESTIDRQLMGHPIPFLQQHQDRLVILDEVQIMPDLFMDLRGVIDRNREMGKKAGQFLLLGSASDRLLKQSSESLTGRVMMHELTGINIQELPENISQDQLWLRGGYPDSVLAADDKRSWRRREAIRKSIVTQDIPQIAGAGYDATRMDAFWALVSQYHGQLFNASKIASALEISLPTVKRYLHIFHDLMLLRILEPWYKNPKKRLIQTPKVFIRDSGMLHNLLRVETLDQLRLLPSYGASWEGFVIEQICQCLPSLAKAYHYRTHAQTEVDLVLEFSNDEIWAIEIKAQETPSIKQRFHNACEDLGAKRKIVIHRSAHDFMMNDGVEALTLATLISQIPKI